MKDQSSFWACRVSSCRFIYSQTATTESDRKKVPEQAAAGPLPRQRRGPGLLRLPDREDDAWKTAEEQAAVPTRCTEPGQGRQTGPEHGSPHQTDGVHLQTACYQGYQSPRKQGEDGPAESRGATATAVLGEASDGSAVVGHHRAGSAQHGPAQRPAGHRAGLRRRRPAVGHRQRPAHELGADHGPDVGGGREEPGHLAEHDPAALQDLHRDGRADPGSGAEGVPGPAQPGGGADGRRPGQSRRKLPGTAAGKDGLKTDRVLLSAILRVSSSTKSRFKPGQNPVRFLQPSSGPSAQETVYTPGPGAAQTDPNQQPKAFNPPPRWLRPPDGSAPMWLRPPGGSAFPVAPPPCGSAFPVAPPSRWLHPHVAPPFQWPRPHVAPPSQWLRLSGGPAPMWLRLPSGSALPGGSAPQTDAMLA